MVAPTVPPGMEETHKLAGLGVWDFDAVRFAEIAPGAGPGKIIGLRLSAQRPRHDMFDVERGTLE
jgi:hypothetical protein